MLLLRRYYFEKS